MHPHHETRLLLRGIGALAFPGVALIHLLDLQSKLHETPYPGVAYLVLIVGLLAATARLVTLGDRAAWLLGGGLAALTLVGYAVNRTVGLPNATGDVGNWLEPLGLASLFVEGLAIATAGTALRLRVGDAAGATRRRREVDGAGVSGPGADADIDGYREQVYRAVGQ